MKFFATITLCALAGAAAESTTIESARQLRAAAGDITKWELTPEGKSLVSGNLPTTTCFQVTCDFGGNMQACAPNLAARLSGVMQAKNFPGKGVYSVNGNAVTFYSTPMYPGEFRQNTVVTGTCDGRTFNAVCKGPGNSWHKC